MEKNKKKEGQGKPEEMPRQIITVGSWNQLMDVLHEDAWNKKIMRHRSNYLFRGHSKSDYELCAGLSRNGGKQVQLEKHLFRNFLKYARSHLGSSENRPNNFWHWIALAQHHGLPTRLLDWTYSPMIAAHFACSNLDHRHCDGAIWMVDYHRAHRDLDEDFRAQLDAEGAHVFTDEMLSKIVSSLDAIGLTREKEQVLFFEPPSVSSRIINQHACFSVQIGHCKPMDNWLYEHRGFWKKIIVPKELKWEIRDKLDQSNITERVLFPGLDGMCAWLARQYFPRIENSNVHS